MKVEIMQAKRFNMMHFFNYHWDYCGTLFIFWSSSHVALDLECKSALEVYTNLKEFCLVLFFFFLSYQSWYVKDLWWLMLGYFKLLMNVS